MSGLALEAREFVEEKWREGECAGARAAYFLSCGMELGDAQMLRGREKALGQLRLERAIERERIKGIRQHWSYDLNRHIALKQALDLIKGAPVSSPDDAGLRVDRHLRRP